MRRTKSAWTGCAALSLKQLAPQIRGLNAWWRRLRLIAEL
jgi:hypothetical protein